MYTKRPSAKHRLIASFLSISLFLLFYVGTNLYAVAANKPNNTAKPSTNLSISNHQLTQLPEGYTLSFNINGGLPPYSINGFVLTGNTFSQTFNCNQNYILYIEDLSNDGFSVAGLSPCGNMPTQDTAIIWTFPSITIDALENYAVFGLSITAVTNSLFGSVVINPDGTLTYTSYACTDGLGGLGFIDCGYVTDVFVYQVTDQFGTTSTGIIAVAPPYSVNTPLVAYFTTNCDSIANTGQYTVNIAIQGGYPPYRVAGTYNEVNITDGQVTFSIPEGSGFQIGVTDEGNGEFTIDQSNYTTCDSSFTYAYDFVAYNCFDEQKASVSIPIPNPVYPIKVWGNSIYDLITDNELPTNPDNAISLLSGSTFDFVVHNASAWNVTVLNGDGNTFTQQGVFDLPNPSFNLPLTACISDAPINLYENSVFAPAAEYLGGQFLFSSAGGLNVNYGTVGQFNPTEAGIGSHLIAYCTNPYNGYGAGFGPGYYTESCVVCDEHTITVANNCEPVQNSPTAAFNTYPTTTDTLYICQGQTVYFNNISQNATNYNWTFGDGTQSNDSNPAHTFNTPGTHEVELVAYTSNASNNNCGLAVDDAFEVDNENQFILNLIENDFPCGNFTIQATGFGCNGDTCSSNHGTIIINDNGTALFTPNPNYSLYIPWSFSYNLVTDYGTSTANVLVSIPIPPCIINPQDINVTIVGNLGGIVLPAIPYTSGFCDLDCGSVPPNLDCFWSVSTPNNGTIEHLGNNFFPLLYTSNPGFIGQDCFTYSITYQGTTYTANFCFTITN